MPTDRRTIFLTGSRGFIGRHLYEAIKHDYDVICGGRNELPPFGVDYIIHLAAVTTTSDMFLPELYESNIVYAKQIMTIPTRIIYASSTSAAELTNPYAFTKRYIEYLGEQHGNATGLRFFNVYGPNNNKGIIKRAFECINNGETLELYGGNNVRDFIHISDVVRTIISSLDSKEKIIEVGTGTGMTIFQALHIIEIIKGSVFDIRVLDGVSTDMQRSVASKGIDGCISFEDGIRLMWKQMNSGVNPDAIKIDI